MPPPTSLPLNIARRSAALAAASAAASTAKDHHKQQHGNTGCDREHPVNNNDKGSPVVSFRSSSFPSNPSSSSTSTTTLYQPSIFRYTCRGRLSLNSRTQHHHAGICHGIQSQLEHIDHWRTATEDEAILWFQTRSAWIDPSSSSPSSRSSSSSSSPSGTSIAGGSSPHGGGGSAHALGTAHVSNVLVYPSTTTSATNHHRNNNNSPIVCPGKEEWSCYGTTEVDLLVLRPQRLPSSTTTTSSNSNNDVDVNEKKEERIVAVAPYCAPGLSIRDIILIDTSSSSSSSRMMNQRDYDDDDDDMGNRTMNTKERTSTLRLGILEILYQSTLDDYGDEEEELEDYADEKEAAVSVATAVTDKDDTKDGMTEKEEKKRIKKKKRNNKNEDDDPTNVRPSFPIRFWNASQSIVKQMQINADLLYQATQEDFLGRTIIASQKIWKELPKQFDRTVDLIWKIMTGQWPPPVPPFDDGDGYGGSGGGPPPPPAM